jgi:hypothetical protein
LRPVCLRLDVVMQACRASCVAAFRRLGRAVGTEFPDRLPSNRRRILKIEFAKILAFKLADVKSAVSILIPVHNSRNPRAAPFLSGDFRV